MLFSASPEKAKQPNKSLLKPRRRTMMLLLGLRLVLMRKRLLTPLKLHITLVLEVLALQERACNAITEMGITINGISKRTFQLHASHRQSWARCSSLLFLQQWARC